MSDDYYTILGIPPSASPEDIKARFRFLSHAYHPDKFGTDGHRKVAEEEFKRINLAYRVLSNPSDRTQYDVSRTRASTQSGYSRPSTEQSPPRPEYEHRPPPRPDYSPPSPPAAPASEARTVAILTYITIVGFIIAIVLHSSKKTALGAYHLRQGLGLVVTGLVLWVASMIIAFIPFINLLTVILWPVIGIGLFVLWLFGLIAAVNGQQKPMPVLGEHYQKWFGGAFV